VTKDTYPYVMEAASSIVLGTVFLVMALLLGGVALFLTPLVLCEAGLRSLCLIMKDAISE